MFQIRCFSVCFCCFSFACGAMFFPLTFVVCIYRDDKDERESQRNASCGDSPDDLNNDDLSLAKSPNLKLSVEQDKKEFR